MENEVKSNKTKTIVWIIVIIIILAGIWYVAVNQTKRTESGAEVKDIATGTSTEISDIQTDLNNLNLDALNQP